MFHILIVDEEEHLLWALENNLLPERDDIQIFTANHGEAALELLRQKSIDVLICDIKMPGKVDGFQLILRAKEVAPDARVVIMTAFGTNRIQNLAERIGITHYIEKPFNISDLRNVVLELLDAKEGFQGVLSDLELTDIIQMLCLAKRTTLLHLKHKEHRGKIVFERGDVIHAEFDDTQGAEAVYAMLALKQGDIYMQSDFLNDRRTIKVGWQDLLLEGVRRADEHHATLADVPMDDGEVFFGDDFGPPRLVSEVDIEPSTSFFSQAELEEIEASSLEEQLASGLHQDGEPTSAGFPSQTRSSPAHDSGASAALRAPQPSPPEDEEEDYPMPPGAPIAGDDLSSPNLFRREITQPTAIAREASLASRLMHPHEAQELGDADSSPTYQGPLSHTMAEHPGNISSMGRPRQITHSEPAARRSAEHPSLSAQAPPRSHSAEHVALSSPRAQPPLRQSVELPPMGQISHVRSLMEDFAREIFGVRVTGVFSEPNGMALDYVQGPRHVDYDVDVLSAFFREVVACASQILQGLDEHDRFRELQIIHDQEVVLIRAIEQTPYIHIAVLNKDVRLGIAIVLMRRYGQKLAEGFKR